MNIMVSIVKQNLHVNGYLYEIAFEYEYNCKDCSANFI